MISSAQTSVIITIHNQLYNGSLKGGGCPSRNLTNQVSVIGNRVSELIKWDQICISSSDVIGCMDETMYTYL